MKKRSNYIISERRFNTMQKIALNKQGKTSALVVIAVIVAIGLLAFIAAYGVTQSVTPKAGAGGAIPSGFQPTASYSAVNTFSASDAVVGTAYYKANGQKASSTALTNVNKGITYKYWVSNSSYYVMPKEFTPTADNTVVQADAYQNGSVTLTLYDLTNRQTSTYGTYNTSIASNGVANVELTYQGTAKKSAMPFGGVMVVEYNNTIASVTATGDGVQASNPYHVTYTTNTSGNTFQVFAISPSLDDGTGSAKKIALQFQAGSADITNPSIYLVKFIPANYYLTNAGDFVLDTEKFANQDNTRTGITQLGQLVWSYWS